MFRCVSLMILIFGLLCTVGCSRREDQVVAEVVGEKIGVRDVEEAYAKTLPKDRKSVMRTLWVLIDRELLVWEAEDRGLGETQHIQESLRKAEADKVMEVHRQHIAEDVVVSEEEMRRYLEEKGLNAKAEVRASHIMVKTRGEAEEILKELENGADFAELARERSIDEASAAKGGDLGYWERGQVVGATARKIFSMKVGETSEPFRSAQGTHIIRVMDERPVGFEAQKPRIERSLRARKIVEKEKAYAEALKRKYRLQMDEKALSLLLHTEDAVAFATKTDHIPRLEREADSTPLLTFDGGAITLGQYLDWVTRLKSRRRPAPRDSARVVQFAEQIALNTVLRPRAFREAGLYESEEVRSYLSNRKRELMVKELRRIEVEEKIITDAAVEEYYRAHREDYFESEAIRVEAMWTETMEAARNAFRKIQAGADMAQVAGVLGAPSDELRNYDIFRFRVSDRHDAFAQEVQNTEVGQLGGPVRASVARWGQLILRYSIFRVLDKTPGYRRALEEKRVQADIRRRLWGMKKAEIEQRFQALLLELRKRYADEIHVYEKKLKLVSLPEEGD